MSMSYDLRAGISLSGLGWWTRGLAGRAIWWRRYTSAFSGDVVLVSRGRRASSFFGTLRLCFVVVDVTDTEHTPDEFDDATVRHEAALAGDGTSFGATDIAR